MTETKIKINYWAVVATGLTAFFLSIIWYSPVLFGEIWERYRHAPNPDIPTWTMVFAPLRELLAAVVLGKLIVRLNLTDWKNTAQLMLLLWLAFHAVGMTGAVLWDNMQWQLGAVHAGDWLMKMLFIGIVLTIWFNRKTLTAQTQA
jgi:hypothetical protein